MVKNPHGRQETKEHGFDFWVRKIPWKRKWQSTSVFLPRKSHGQRGLVGYSAQGHGDLDMSKLDKT